jgi:hypothetical protein
VAVATGADEIRLIVLAFILALVTAGMLAGFVLDRRRGAHLS